MHRLIRSMSSAEKRYYKLNLARHGHATESVQEQLFDAIAGMEHYNEPALLRHFEGAAFLGHFAITKRRLYESILKSLEGFHADCSATARINRILHQVEILHQRALYDDAWKALQSARRLAERHQSQLGTAAVLEWERRLVECRNYAEEDEASLTASREGSAAVLATLATIGELWHLKSTIFLHLYRNGATLAAPLDDGTIEDLLDSATMQHGAAEEASRVRFMRLHIRSAARFAQGRLEDCRVALAENLELLDGNKAHFVDEPNLALGVMGNLAYVTARCGHYAEARALLKRFRELPARWLMPETEDLELKIFNTTTSLELSMHLRLGEAQEALHLIPVVERGLRKHERHIGPVRRAALEYLMAYAFFTAGEHDRSLRCVNGMLNSLRQEDRSDTARFARLLQLLLYLESGRKDLLRYALRNAERFLRKHRGATAIELRMLKTIKALAAQVDVNTNRKELGLFVTQATELLRRPSEQAILDHLDPITWAESKLTGELFAAVAKRRAAAMDHAA